MRKSGAGDGKIIASGDLERHGGVLNDALDQVAEAVLVLDREFRITYVNPAFEHLLGYSPEDVLGKPLSILSVPGQLDSLQPEEIARRVHESGWWHGEVHRRAKDGSAIPFKLTASAIRDERGGVTGYVGTYLDLREVRRVEQHFQSLIEHSSDIITLFDRTGTVLYTSPSVQRVLGHAPEALLGKDPFFLIHPDDVSDARRIITEALRNPDKTYHLEFRLRHADGRYIDVEAVGSSLSGDATVPSVVFNTRVITARKQAEDALRHANRALKALSACNSMLVHAVDEARLFSDMCRILVETGGYSHAWIGNVEHDAAKRIRPVARAGFESDFSQEPTLTWADNESGQNPVGIAVREGMAMVVRDVLNDPALAFWRPTLARLGVNAICVFPLIYGGETFGALSIYSSERDAFGQDELELLAELADDLNFGVLTLRTSIERDHAVEKHQHSLEQLRESLESTISAIAATLEMRDPYTAGHERRVAELATAIAREMGLPQDKIKGIHFGALIHDLGKIKVPAEILSKPTALTKSEFDLVKEHAQSGYDILKGIRFPWPVAKMAQQHHERVDGSGYPDGIKGEAFLLESRILAVADVVEAMSSHRPYRPALGVEAALAEIIAHSGTWYDADAVDACLRLFKEKGFTLNG